VLQKMWEIYVGGVTHVVDGVGDYNMYDSKNQI